ncbi:membrane protein insertion efficiency factor YidD [Oryzihumus sp.]|uniref:membrane protein insertion efficiency factor YidD n=1 Tax=Oryzihumus sp. TaxID=1968903 RepID=UPI002ED8E806
MGPVGRAIARPAIWLIRGYQLLLSPMHPPTCRFYPSCSAYAVTALERFGLFRGGWLAVRRLLRCHPWNPGGVDHVPQDVPSGTPRPRHP